MEFQETIPLFNFLQKNMKKLSFLLLLFIGLTSFNALHKFYVSVTEIEYNEKAKSLQIISRVFTDDFENLLKKRYDEKIRLGKNYETAGASDYFGKYLEQKLEIKVDGKPVKINYLGREYDNDMILLYIEVENMEAFSKIEIKNTVLMDLFSEQKNLVHVEFRGKTKSLVLADGKEEDVLNF